MLLIQKLLFKRFSETKVTNFFLNPEKKMDLHPRLTTGPGPLRYGIRIKYTR